MSGEALLQIKDFSVAFRQANRETLAVDRISFDLKKGETVAVVGESGSGKSVTGLSVLRLLPSSAHHPSGEVLFQGRDLLKLSEQEIREVRGNDITMVFQEPMTSLNPVHTIGQQIVEMLEVHRGMRGEEARKRVIELLTEVGIPTPEERLGSYPHQLSGGQRQRVMIALALANEPDLFIADEPTTALDVTVQAQILRLLADLQRDLGLGMLLITHDLGIVARVATRVSVMYAGEVVESAATAQLFADPKHPYTQGLLRCVPVPGKQRQDEPLGSIPGTVPRVGPGFEGCAFRERCSFADETCAHQIPRKTASPGHDYLCRLPT